MLRPTSRRRDARSSASRARSAWANPPRPSTSGSAGCRSATPMPKCTGSMTAMRCPQSKLHFLSAVRGGKVDRALLAQEVAGSPEKLARLESIVHPMVVKAEIDFLREAGEARRHARACSRSRYCSRPMRTPQVDVYGRGERAGRGAESARARTSGMTAEG